MFELARLVIILGVFGDRLSVKKGSFHIFSRTHAWHYHCHKLRGNIRHK